MRIKCKDIFRENVCIKALGRELKKAEPSDHDSSYVPNEKRCSSYVPNEKDVY